MKEQLDEAGSKHEKAWVMSHIPPGVDAFREIVHRSAVRFERTGR